MDEELAMGGEYLQLGKAVAPTKCQNKAGPFVQPRVVLS